MSFVAVLDKARPATRALQANTCSTRAPLRQSDNQVDTPTRAIQSMVNGGGLRKERAGPKLRRKEPACQADTSMEDCV